MLPPSTRALHKAVERTFVSPGDGHADHSRRHAKKQVSHPKQQQQQHRTSPEQKRSPKQRKVVVPPLPTASDGEDATLPLDAKLADLLRALTPTLQDRQRKLAVLTDAKKALANVGLHCDIYGSLRTGLVIPSSDIDCVMVADMNGASAKKMPAALDRSIRNLAQIHVLTSRERKLCYSGGVRAVAQAIRSTRKFGSVLTIAHAKVPIVKSQHKEEDVKVDFSFEKDGLTTSQFLCEEMQRPGNELARGLTVLVKTIIANWGLDDPSVGGLGSFPTAMMVLWYLQCEAPKFPAEIRGSLGVLLCGFLKFFGNDFDYRRAGLDYIQRKTFTKPFSSELFVVNPISPGANCAKAAHLFAARVVPSFAEAAKALSELMDFHASPTRIEAVLQRFFRDAFPACEDWREVTRMAARSLRTPQHMWDPESKLYTGGLL